VLQPSVEDIGGDARGLGSRRSFCDRGDGRVYLGLGPAIDHKGRARRGEAFCNRMADAGGKPVTSAVFLDKSILIGHLRHGCRRYPRPCP
jgi:hypothetical protein